ncbi:MAG TPA: DMT family transporter [Steroidobacteraceae bacterium]|nr:DMT family transporter [Steroidobacteraceae bacterium]
MSATDLTAANAAKPLAPAAKPADHMAAWRTPLELTLLGAIWGASFMFMRVAAADFGPFPLVEMRLAFGALVLTPFLWRARAQFSGMLYLRIAGIAMMNATVPLTLFAWAAERAPAGIGAISNGMTVMFTALVAFVFFGERIGARRLMGLIIGFVGVTILASGKTAGVSVAPAALAGTAASLCYGIGINLVRRYLTPYPPAAVAAAALTSGALLIAPLALWNWPHHPLPPVSWVSALLLGVLCTGFAFVLYYRLVARIGAARTSTVTYLIPLFGVIWAWLLLGEGVTLSMVLAGALILAGVGLSQRRDTKREAKS